MEENNATTPAGRQWRAGQFRDDPEKRETRLREAPKGMDQFGNPLLKLGHYWCSSDFTRFWQLVVDESADDEHVIVVRVCDAKPFSRARHEIRRAKRYWKRRLETQWYMFVDPVTQTPYL